jgi:hypothetical protein
VRGEDVTVREAGVDTDDYAPISGAWKPPERNVAIDC